MLSLTAEAAGGGISPPAEAAWLLLYTMRFGQAEIVAAKSSSY